MSAPVYDLADKRVWVTGHRGLVGSALLRRLEREPVAALLGTTRETLDLRDASAVRDWVIKNRPDAIIHAAGTVGGIAANAARPADFLFDNMMMAGAVVDAAHKGGVERLLFLGSSCIYPKHADQPITEDALLTGTLEPTNEAYAVAKIAGLKLCEAYRAQHGADFISAMPTNLYGPGDTFDVENSHVLPALLRKARLAVEAGEPGIAIWGTGTPRREFLHVDDAADGLVHILQHYDEAGPINLGTGEDIAIADLARLVMDVAGLPGKLTTDPSKPDGTPLKRLDVSRLTALGWRPSIGLREGVEATWRWYLDQPL